MVWAVPSLSELLLARALPCVNPVGGGSGVPLVPVLAVGGSVAPKGTPWDIIDKLNAAAVGTTHDPAMRQKLVDQGFVIPPREQQTPEALAAMQKAEIAKWWPIIKVAGIKAE